MTVPARYLKELNALFASIKTEKEAEMLLEDILTPQERESLAERWQLVRELSKGTPQRDIAERLNISISKVTRGSRQLQYGTGGFATFLKRLKR